MFGVVFYCDTRVLNWMHKVCIIYMFRICVCISPTVCDTVSVQGFLVNCSAGRRVSPESVCHAPVLPAGGAIGPSFIFNNKCNVCICGSQFLYV